MSHLVGNAGSPVRIYVLCSRCLLHAHHRATCCVSLVGLVEVHSRIHTASCSGGDGWLLDWGLLRPFAFRLLSNYIQHALLQLLLVLAKSILLPGVIDYLRIQVVALHALLEKLNAELVVWFVFELETAAVLHEVLELAGVPLAELVEGGLELLLLNILVLFIFVFARLVLPWQATSKEVEYDVTYGFQVVSPGLLFAHMGG